MALVGSGKELPNSKQFGGPMFLTFWHIVKMSNDITFAKKSNKVLYCKSYEDIKILFEKITKVPN